MLLIAIAYNAYSQSSASESGIAVQGIARDANNTAMASQALVLQFTIYYLDATNNPVEIHKETTTLNTDAFGVFSYVINPGATKGYTIANRQSYLKIEKGGDIISNEKLRHVPYAIAANNGVPTGAIMPFMGTVAPAGWALCNGDPLPSEAVDLIAMIGANSPDLRGMFLRGTGTSAVNGQDGPALAATQGDTLKQHNHSSGTLTAKSGGAHSHTVSLGMDKTNADGDRGSDKRYGTDDSDGTFTGSTSVDGAHGHSIEGSTANTGGNETRPVNYGVNYIIKL